MYNPFRFVEFNLTFYSLYGAYGLLKVELRNPIKHPSEPVILYLELGATAKVDLRSLVGLQEKVKKLNLLY